MGGEFFLVHDCILGYGCDGVNSKFTRFVLVNLLFFGEILEVDGVSENCNFRAKISNRYTSTTF